MKQVWECKDGRHIAVKDMTNGHLLNATKMLQRWLVKCKEATHTYLHPFWGPHGEMAQNAADQAMEEMWDRELSTMAWLGIFRAELRSRNIEIPTPPEPNYLPDPVSVEVIGLPGGGSGLIAELPKPQETEEEYKSAYDPECLRSRHCPVYPYVAPAGRG